MKKDKRLQANYQKAMDARIKNAEAQILNDSLTNPLLKRAGELPDYFKHWIDGSKLVAVIPALEKDDPNSNSYYSVGVIQNGVEQNKIRVSPVFMYINKNFYDYTEKQEEIHTIRCFTFDSEESKLYSYEKIKHSQQYQCVKKETFGEMQQHIVDNPVVLFFKGCDDGHVGKRFKSEDEAFEYLQLIDVFEDIFDKDIQYHN